MPMNDVQKLSGTAGCPGNLGLAAENADKCAGWDCWWPSCDKTVNDETLYRTRPKGQPGEFMCSQHAQQRRVEEADRG